MHTDCNGVTLYQQARKREKESAEKISISGHAILCANRKTLTAYIRPSLHFYGMIFW